MIAFEALVVVVNVVLLGLVGAGRLDKTIFYRFVMLTIIGGLGASKVGLLHDHRAFATMVIGIGLLDLLLVSIFYIVLALRRREPRAKGNILSRLRETYSPTVRRILPDWDRPELAEVTNDLEKQGFHACADFEEVAEGETHGPMRAFLNGDRTTAAFAFLRQDSRKNIQPTAVNFVTQLSGNRWVVTSPTPSKRSFAVLPRPANVHRVHTPTGWSATTAAKTHATHVAERIAEEGGNAVAIENTFSAWCDHRNAYWAEVCAFRKSVGWLTKAESIEMFGNVDAHREVVRLLRGANETGK